LTEDETGWKMIHGDVFRSPQYTNIFVALVGAGAQVFGTAFAILLCVLMGVFKATKRGALLTAAIVIFSCCGFLGGLVCGRLYKQLKGKDWAWNVILTASIMPVPLASVFTFVNGVAVSNNSTAALPTLVILVCILYICIIYCTSKYIGYYCYVHINYIFIYLYKYIYVDYCCNYNTSTFPIDPFWCNCW